MTKNIVQLRHRLTLRDTLNCIIRAHRSSEPPRRRIEYITTVWRQCSEGSGLALDIGDDFVGVLGVVGTWVGAFEVAGVVVVWAWRGNYGDDGAAGGEGLGSGEGCEAAEDGGEEDL